MDADGQVRHRAGEHDRALRDRLRRDAVRDVEDRRVARDPLHHAVADADEVVLEPEVGQERDRSRTRLRGLSRTPPPPRRARRGRGVSASTATVEPDRRARRGSSRARSRPPAPRRRSRHTRAPPSPTRARRRRPSGGSGVQQARAVERDEVGAELVDRPAPRVLGREKSTRPSGRGNSASEPVLRSRPTATKAGSIPWPRSVSAVPGPDGRDLRQVPRAPGDLVGAVRARHDQPTRSRRSRSARRRCGRSRSAGTRRPRARAPRAARRAAAPGRAAG